MPIPEAWPPAPDSLPLVSQLCPIQGPGESLQDSCEYLITTPQGSGKGGVGGAFKAIFSGTVTVFIGEHN